MINNIHNYKVKLWPKFKPHQNSLEEMSKNLPGGYRFEAGEKVFDPETLTTSYRIVIVKYN